MRIVEAEVRMDEEKMPMLIKEPAKLYKPLQHLSCPEVSYRSWLTFLSWTDR